LHVDHIAEEIGGDIPIGRVNLLPMILGGDIYQMHTYKIALYLNKEHICIIPGGSDGHMGSMSDVSSALHHSDIPYSKGERLFRGRSKAFRQGSNPKEISNKGSKPKRRMTLCH
jgi:hypothetical protein